MRSASSNRELSLRGARLSDSHAGDPTVQRAGDGPVDCLTAVPAARRGPGRRRYGRTARPPPTERGGLTGRMRRIRPRLSSITVAASSYVGAPTGASYRCRWDPPRHRHSTPQKLLRSRAPRFSGVKIIRLLTSPRVRFSDAALRRELPELVRCAARGPAYGPRQSGPSLPRVSGTRKPLPHAGSAFPTVPAGPTQATLMADGSLVWTELRPTRLSPMAGR